MLIICNQLIAVFHIVILNVTPVVHIIIKVIMCAQMKMRDFWNVNVLPYYS